MEEAKKDKDLSAKKEKVIEEAMKKVADDERKAEVKAGMEAALENVDTSGAKKDKD